MVATVQPQGLPVSETDRPRRCLRRCQSAEMQSFRATIPDLLRGERGWMSQIKTAAPGGGRKMFLTSPFIDQAISLRTRSMSASGDVSPTILSLRSEAPVLLSGIIFKARPSVFHKISGPTALG